MYGQNTVLSNLKVFYLYDYATNLIYSEVYLFQFFFNCTLGSRVHVQILQDCCIGTYMVRWFAAPINLSSTLGISPNAIYPRVFPTPFIRQGILSPLLVFVRFVKDQMVVDVWCCL